MKANFASVPDKNSYPSLLASLWGRYKHFVENATKGNFKNDEGGIGHWREKLFSGFITYFIPVCLVALVPGVFMALKVGVPVIAVFDVLAAGCLVTIALSSKIDVVFRKVFVMSLLYLVGAFFLIYLGIFGPGLLYLLATSTFIALLFSRAVVYYSIAANFFICVLCAVIINFRLFNSPLFIQCSLGAWIAVSSNLVFLSAITIVLINYAIKTLEDKINEEFLLKSELKLVNNENTYQNGLLQESEVHYKSLFLHSPLPMLILDGNTLQFLQVNEAALKSYGYTNKEFLYITLNELKLEKDPAPDSAIEKLIEGVRDGLNAATAASTTRIAQHRRKNGEGFYTETKFTSITFKGRDAILVVARDLTEQINFVRAIESQNAKLSEIAWIQSHLVRAPLARIMALVDILTKNEGERQDGQILKYLDQSAKEFDGIIKTIIENTEHVKVTSGVL